MLRPARASEIKPYRLSCVDIETDQEGEVLAVGAIVDDEYQAFDSWDDWYDWYSAEYKRADRDRKRRMRKVYAHNGVGFDWLSLFEWACNRFNSVRVKYISSGSIAIGIDIRLNRDATLKLRDSLRLLPATLKHLSATFNVEHQKLDVDPTTLAQLKRVSPAQFWEYLEHDVRGLQEILYKFWTYIETLSPSIGELPMTLPSLALKLYRRELTDDIMVPWEKHLKKFERRAYTGGRTSCFETGVFSNVECDDVNSMYPYVMAHNHFPGSYRGAWTDRYDGIDGLYEIEYSQPETPYRPLLRDEKSNEFQYTGKGVYYQPEIEKLRELGGTFTVIRGYIFYDMRPLFGEFIEKWYAIRKDATARGDEALSYSIKIMLNSLYGKFGQREVSETLYMMSPAEQRELEPGTYRNVSPDWIAINEPTKSEHIFVSIAGYVTAYARLELFNHFQTIIDSGGRVYYCDTDSVYHNAPDALYPARGPELGQLKREDDLCGTIAFAGKKLYARKGGKVKAKGIGKLVIGDALSFVHIVRLLKGESIPFKFQVFPSPRDVFIRNVKTAKPLVRMRTLKATGPSSSGPGLTGLLAVS